MSPKVCLIHKLTIFSKVFSSVKILIPETSCIHYLEICTMWSSLVLIKEQDFYSLLSDGFIYLQTHWPNYPSSHWNWLW